MTAAGRTDRALFLAAVAVAGLVVTPILHAEQHQHEHAADVGRVVEAWEAESPDPLDALAYALEHVHEGGKSKPPADDSPGHSHGPSAPGAHGQGALGHLGLALHAAPAVPRLTPEAPLHASPGALIAQLQASLRYLVPRWSQGPPAICGSRPG